MACATSIALGIIASQISKHAPNAPMLHDPLCSFDELQGLFAEERSRCSNILVHTLIYAAQFCFSELYSIVGMYDEACPALQSGSS